MIKKLLPLFILLMVLSSGCADLSTVAVSTPMPVTTVDYVSSTSDQEGGKYWRIATAVDGSGESYYLELPESTLQDGDVQSQKYLKLYLRPTNPYWHADCYDEEDLTYAYAYDVFTGITMTYKGYDDVPYTRISGTGQTIHTGYTATLEDENGVQIATGNYNEDDVNQGTLQMTAKDSDGFTRTIYITMDAMLPTGVLTPTGEYATLWDGTNSRSDSCYMLVNYLTLQNKLTTYNSKTVSYLGEDWPDCYAWLVNNGVSDFKTSSNIVNYDFEGVGLTTGSHPTGLKLYYNTGTWKPLVTVYIPEQLAETIVEEKAAPEPSIEEIDDISALESGSVTWQVKVSNYGTAGDVKISAITTDGSNGLQNIRTSTDAQQYIGAGKSYTWTFYADIADELTDSTRDVSVTVTANGGVGGQFGTTDTESFVVSVTDIDDITEDDTVTLTIKGVYEDTGEVYENAPLFVGYGSDARVGSGETTYTAVIGTEYNIYSEDSADGVYLTQYTSEEPYKVTPYTDLTIEIEFGDERPSTDWNIDMDTIIIGLVLVLVIVLLWKFGALDFIFQMLQEPIVIAVILFAIVVIYAVSSLSAAADSLSSTVDSVAFWK